MHNKCVNLIYIKDNLEQIMKILLYKSTYVVWLQTILYNYITSLHRNCFKGIGPNQECLIKYIIYQGTKSII